MFDGLVNWVYNTVMTDNNMTKQEFLEKLNDELTPTELVLATFNFYLNPKHVDYFMDYKMGEFRECYDYLMGNKQFLTLKHTPRKFKLTAIKQVKAAKKMAKSKQPLTMIIPN